MKNRNNDSRMDISIVSLSSGSLYHLLSFLPKTAIQLMEYL